MIPHIPSSPGVSTRSNSSDTARGPEITPKKVHMCVPLEQIAVVFDDDKGVRRKTVVIRVGDQLYTHPNAEAWAAGLLPVPAGHWLSKGVEEQRPRTAAAVTPPSDQVEFDQLLVPVR
jgi:hypothetical protein